MAEIRLNGIAKRFGNDVYALHPTDLTIRNGEFLTLLGPSGCGKTTTLRMIAGLEDPSAGEIHFDEKRIDRLTPGKRNVAMVFQNYALYPHMTVRGNLEYPLKKRGVPQDQRARQVQRTAEILHIGELLERRPRQLSGGQQQRVALGRAMIRDPAVFLFDEPLSNLDAQLRAVMRAELTRLHDEISKTMVYVTHDQLEAMTMSDRIVVLYLGRIQQVGTPKEIYSRPANRFVASFVGTPAMNFIDGRIARDGGDFSVALMDGASAALAVGTAGLEDGRAVVAGVRPEHITIGGGGIPARVTLVEDLGHEAQVSLRVGSSDFIARAPAGIRLGIGETLAIGFEPSAVHLFDPADGIRIETRDNIHA
jgi:ABC-type sugar transport system ATPase subunit